MFSLVSFAALTSRLVRYRVTSIHVDDIEHPERPNHGDTLC